MRGSAVFRTGIAPGGALAPGWVKNELWRKARTVPSLDLRFADNKSLVDAVTGAQLVTFTRASSGTFVGSDGLLKTAVTNLLLRSEEFDNASWTKIATTVLANQIQSPIGTLTADEIIEDSSTGTHYVTNGSVSSSVSGTAYTYSVYVKAGQRAFCFLLANGTGTLQVVSVNLSTGVATSAVGSPSSITSTDVGNGWYRISFSYTSGTTGSVGHEVRLSTNGIWGDRSYTGNGAGSVYAWGAQLEQSATVGEYIPTTSAINSAPRFDHNPTTGESLGLLVEEARTNLVLRSEEFDDAAWTKTNSTVTADGAISPDGTMDADKIVSNSASLGFVVQSVSQATGTSYTWSVFAKAGEYSFCQLRITGTVVLSVTRAYFNLATGTTTGTANCTASITAFGNGWYKCSITYTTILAATASPRFYGQVDAADTVGDGTSGIYIWGAQMEAGAFPTSYIPTTTATVTRAADVASITGSNFSSWYNQTEGTVFVDSVQAHISPTSRLVSASDNTTSNRVALSRAAGSSGNISLTVTNAGSAQVSSLVFGTALAAGTSNKVAAIYKAADFAGSVNGLAAVTQGTGTVPSSLTQLAIGNGDILGANPMTGTIKRLTYWPVRLPTAPSLQAISQP